MVEKLSIINLGSYSSKSSTSVVLSDSEATFLGKSEDAAFVHISILFSLTLHHKQNVIQG